jgi:hypothetical protein
MPAKFKQTESQLQQQCVKWFRLQPKFRNYNGHDLTGHLFSIPNGGKRSAVTGAIMKREGARAGVADLFLMKCNLFNNGLFIELKVGKNKQQPSQETFEQDCRWAGYKYAVCRSLDEFIATITDYLNDKA